LFEKSKLRKKKLTKPKLNKNVQILDTRYRRKMPVYEPRKQMCFVSVSLISTQIRGFKLRGLHPNLPKIIQFFGGGENLAANYLPMRGAKNSLKKMILLE